MALDRQEPLRLSLPVQTVLPLDLKSALGRIDSYNQKIPPYNPQVPGPASSLIRNFRPI